MNINPRSIRLIERCKRKMIKYGYRLAPNVSIPLDNLTTTKIPFVCPRGHTHSTTIQKFAGGSDNQLTEPTCKDCFLIRKKKANQKQNEKTRLEREKHFQRQLKKEKYKLVSIYQNIDEPVYVSCKNDHLWKTTPKNFTNQGNRCPYCKGVKPKKTHLQERLEVDLWILELKQLSKNGNILTLQCKNKECQHIFDSSSPIPCPRCSSDIVKDFKAKLIESSYELLESYVDNETKVLVRCPVGHEYKTSPTNFRFGRRCPHCKLTGYNKSKSGYFYLVKWTKDNDSFYKFGITNNPVSERIRNQKRKTEHTPSIMLIRYFEDGSIPADIETDIHSSLHTSFSAKEVFGDGFTETCERTVDNLRSIRKILEKHQHKTTKI